MLQEKSDIHGVYAAQELRSKIRREWHGIPADKKSKAQAGLWARMEACAGRRSGIPGILADCNASAAVRTPGGCAALCGQVARRLTSGTLAGAPSSSGPGSGPLGPALLDVLAAVPREADELNGTGAERAAVRADLAAAVPAVLASLKQVLGSHPPAGTGSQPPAPTGARSPRAEGWRVLAAWASAVPALDLASLRKEAPEIAGAIPRALAAPLAEHAEAKEAALALPGLVPATRVRDMPPTLLRDIAGACAGHTAGRVRAAVEAAGAARSEHEAEPRLEAAEGFSQAALALLEAAPAWVCGPGMAETGARGAGAGAPPPGGSAPSMGARLLELGLEVLALPVHRCVFPARSAWVSLACLEAEEGGLGLARSGMWARVALVGAGRCQYPPGFVPGEGCWTREDRGVQVQGTAVPKGRTREQGSVCAGTRGYLTGD